MFTLEPILPPPVFNEIIDLRTVYRGRTDENPQKPFLRGLRYAFGQFADDCQERGCQGYYLIDNKFKYFIAIISARQAQSVCDHQTHDGPPISLMGRAAHPRDALQMNSRVPYPEPAPSEVEGRVLPRVGPLADPVALCQPDGFPSSRVFYSPLRLPEVPRRGGRRDAT